MAYFRGDTYIWSNGDDLHLWSRNGLDNWNNSQWSEDENGNTLPNASGVAISEEVIDQLVMMRLAEILVYETPQQIEKLIDDACEVGNFGSDCLKANAHILKETLASLQLRKPESPE